MRNFLKTILLLTSLAFFVAFCGYSLGGRNGMIAAFIFAGLTNISLYWFNDGIMLAIHRAQPLARDEAPEVFEILEELSRKAGIPVPRLYMLPSASANAFATGRDPKHAAIAIAHGLAGLLNREELSGVLAHELSHILNRDILFSSIVAIMAGALGMIAAMFRWSFFWGGERDNHDNGHSLALILTSILMPIIALFIQLTILRSREYGADVRGAGLCENPLYLASALKKIDLVSRQVPLRDGGPATAHLFIVNPLSGKGWLTLFGTHPSIEDRIVRLEALSNAAR